MIKHGFLGKKKGFFIKSFMPYEVFMLENGVLLFYGRKSNSSKFGKEDVKHRI